MCCLLINPLTKVAKIAEVRSPVTPSLGGDAFEWYGSYSSHREECETKHPLAGARSIAPKTRGPGIVYDLDPARVSY